MAKQTIRSARTARKPKQSMVTICIYMSRELAESLARAANEERRSISEVARFILEAKLLKGEA